MLGVRGSGGVWVWGLVWFFYNDFWKIVWKSVGKCAWTSPYFTQFPQTFTQKRVWLWRIFDGYNTYSVFGIQKVKLSLYTWNENEIYGSWYLESIWNSLYQIVFGIFYHFRYTFQLFPIIGACVCLCDVGIISFFEHFIWIHF